MDYVYYTRRRTYSCGQLIVGSGILPHDMSSALAQQIFRNGSTTYFTASLFFPPQVKTAVFTLYAFVRTVDDFVDKTPQDVTGFYQFEKDYRRALHAEDTQNTVIADFVTLQRKYALPQQWIDAFFWAMKADLYKAKYETLRELELYMYGSAEVIGLLLCRIMQISPKGYPAARLLGRGMQYANILRDIAEDYKLGRQYLPQEVLNIHCLKELTPQSIKKNPEEFAQLFAEEVERYLVWKNEAERGFVYLPLALRIPVAAASMMYTWTVTELQKNPSKVLAQQLKPSKWRVVRAVLSRTLWEYRQKTV